MISALLGEAWRAMAVNRLRTLLTMLGMIIGVGAVVLMLAIGQGVQYVINQSITSMGANLFIILPGASTSGGIRFGAGSAATLNLEDAQALEDLNDVGAVAPIASGTAQLVYGGANWSTLVTGTTPSYLKVRDWTLKSGQPFGNADLRSASRVALLGQTVVTNLFGDENPVGKTVRILNSPFQVIGVLASKGQSLDGRDQDDTVLVPVTTAQRKLFGTQLPGSVGIIMVQGRSAQVMNEAQSEMERLLRQRHRIGKAADDDFTIRNLTALLETAASTARILSFMLGAIASISLLVGGIGIMNIMLVSVTERTREIGIRMAVGALPWEVMIQFLLEAMIMSILGSVIGIALGMAGAWIVSTLAGITVVVTLWSVLLAFIVAAGIGIFFGYYPAQKGAHLKPIEALRYE
ncbi:MAG: ABC transporter permease [Acidiferrobacterales bacterium]